MSMGNDHGDELAMVQLFPVFEKIVNIIDPNANFPQGKISFMDLMQGKPYKGPRMHGDILIGIDKSQSGEIIGGEVQVLGREGRLTRNIFFNRSEQYVEEKKERKSPSPEEVIKAERALRSAVMSLKSGLN